MVASEGVPVVLGRFPMVIPFYGRMRDDLYFGMGYWDQTELRRFSVSPLEWAAARYRPAAPWMAFGAAAHSLVLGAGPAVGLSGDGQPHQTDLAVSLPQADLARVRDMAAVTRPVFRRLHGEAEMTMVSVDPASRLILKGKADFVETDGHGLPVAVWDYKTTSSPLDGWYASIDALGYDMQAVTYLRLLSLAYPRMVPDTIVFRWLVQQTRPPYDYRIYEAQKDDPVIRRGKSKLTSALAAVNGFEREHPEGIDILSRAYAPGHHRRRRIARAVARYGDQHYITPLCPKE